MNNKARVGWNAASALLPVVTVALAAALFIADILTPPHVAVAVLYVAVVMMTARFSRPGGVVLAGAGCAALTAVSYFLGTEIAVNAAIAVAAIALTTVLAMRDQKTEARLREQASLLDLTHDVVISLTMDGIITYWNHGAEELYGWPRSEALGKVARDLLETRFPEPREEIHVRLLQLGRYEGEFVNQRRDRTPITVASRWSLQRDRQGRPTAMLVTSNDITERKRAEQALHDSEEQWREVFEHNPAMYFMVGADGTVLSVNSFGALQLGYTADELIGRSVLAVFPEEERQSATDYLATCVAEPGRSHQWEIRKIRKDGSLLWVQENAKAVRRPGADLIVLIACEDITERKRTEAALRASEVRWRTVFERATVGVVTLDLEARFTMANQAFETMIGYTADELRELTVLDISHEDDREITRSLTGDLAAGRRLRYRVDKRYRRKDGAVVWIDGNTTIVPATENTPAFYAAIIVDITDRKNAEEALQQAQADIARLNRVLLLGEMTSSIAHEINQPIAAVITNANAGLRWLRGPPPDLDEVRQALTRIVRDGNRAGEVIGRVRALVKKVPPRRETLVVDEAVQEAIALTQAQLQRNQVTLQIRLADRLPPVMADRVQIQQVLINLIVNACEAMSGIDRPRELTIASGESGSDGVFAEVRDTGPGLDPANLDRLFQSFFTTKPEGMGMGLAISRSIVETHGGRLVAAANQPCGAVFRITLPVEGGVSADPAAPPALTKSG